LPFRRLRLVLSALVIGTFAPDFVYFLRMAVEGRIGHTFAGVFVFTLPAALAVLWLFQEFVKQPVTLLLPVAIQRRMARQTEPFRFRGFKRFSWIVFSALVGIATHLLWDSFTHMTTWPYRHFSLLQVTVHLPIGRPRQMYWIFQQGSTVIGCGVLLLWFWLWYRSTEPCNPLPEPAWTAARKLRIAAIIFTIATVGTLVRVDGGVGFSVGFAMLLGQTVVTFMALIWWELVLFGIYRSRFKEPRTSRGSY